MNAGSFAAGVGSGARAGVEVRGSGRADDGVSETFGSTGVGSGRGWGSGSLRGRGPGEPGRAAGSGAGTESLPGKGLSGAAAGAGRVSTAGSAGFGAGLGSGVAGAIDGGSIAGPATAGAGIEGRSSLTGAGPGVGVGSEGGAAAARGLGGGSAGFVEAVAGWGRTMGSSAGLAEPASARGFVGGVTATSVVGDGLDIAGRPSAGGVGSVGEGGVTSSGGFARSGSGRRVDGFAGGIGSLGGCSEDAFSTGSFGGAASGLPPDSGPFSLPPSSFAPSASSVPEAAASAGFSSLRVTRFTTRATTRIRNDASAATPTRVSRRALARGSFRQSIRGNRRGDALGSGPTACSASTGAAVSPPVSAFFRPNLGSEAVSAPRLNRGKARDAGAGSSRFGSVPGGGVSDGSSPRVGSWSGIARRPSVSRFALGGWRPARSRTPSRVSWSGR